MPDKNVGWLVPASAVTDNMRSFQDKLQQLYRQHGNVGFPNPQFLNGDNANLDDCVKALMDGDFDAFAVAGSTGVRALAEAQAGQANKIPIIQVVGGDPVPANSTFITGYHIHAHKVAGEQVGKLNQKFPNVAQITVLMDYSSDTAPRALNAIIRAVKKLNADNNLNIQVRTPVFVRNSAELHALRQQPNNPVVGSLLLTPSGMFYDINNMRDIVWLVENANVPAIYPEHEFRHEHTPNYRQNIRVWGHKIPETYVKAAGLANDALQGNLQAGQEAPDMDDVP